MSSETIRVKYDGPALAGHFMDVADLAPALLSISDLCKSANRKFNGDRASVSVLISADVKQNCIQFDLQIVQSLWQQAQGLLDNTDLKSAKEILEWLDLIEVKGGALLGLLGLLAKIRGSRIEKAEPVTDSATGKQAIQLSIKGDGNTVVWVAPQTYQMLQDPAAIKSAKKIIEPLTKDGYEKLEVESAGKLVAQVSKEQAVAAMQYSPPDSKDDFSEEPQQIIAWIKVHSPVLDTTSKNWQFLYAEHTPFMDISETDIALKAAERGSVGFGDAYKVRLQITQTISAKNKIANHYKILEVLDFRQAAQQMNLLPPNDAA